MENSWQKVGVGVGVMLMRDGKVLFGKRHDDPEKAKSLLHGAGTWTLPGGKLDFGEELKTVAAREVFEETSIKVNEDSLKVIGVDDNIVEAVHFVTISFLAEDFEGEPKVMEPDEITQWQWFELDKLPEPIYFPSEKSVKRYLSGKIY